ncbi:MAG: SRPBCC family protein [Rhizomicrobium sp.]
MTTQKNEVTLVRLLNAPREAVWRAWREPEALRHWWGLPNGATMPTCTIDFRVGGVLHCEIAMLDRPRIWFKWIYREIVEAERLVLEQHFSDASARELDSPERPVSTITVRLEEANGKTKLTITHAGMASETYPAEMYQEGWSESLDRLAACLAQR